MAYDLLDKALSSALCPMFQALVPATSTVAVVAPFFGPKGFAASMVAAPVSSLSMLGASATCPEAEIGPDPLPGIYDPRKGCTEVSQGDGALFNTDGQGNDSLTYGRLTGYKVEYIGPDPVTGYDSYALFVQTSIGGLYYREPLPVLLGPGRYFRMDLSPGAVCAESTDGVPTNPDVPDHVYTDPETNCNYTVKFEGFIQEAPGGAIQPVFQISGGETGVRTEGGRMGACNLSPVIHVGPPNGPGGPGGPPIPPIPVPPIPGPGPGGGVPWWASPLLAGSTAAALNLIGEALNDLFETKLPAGSFTLTAPCDKDEDGNPLEQTWTYPEQKVQERMLAHQITQLEALQTHLNWKTPICRDTPKKEGTWISTRWESDSNSPANNRPLRKLFRYRSKSTLTDEQLRVYWKDFVWEAGSVCVIHKGAWWGTPQIWAASSEEGKRVIRFAGLEAGIDPDQVGEWTVSSSNSPRYGMPGTMRLEIAGGVRWVTRREGASGFPGQDADP